MSGTLLEWPTFFICKRRLNQFWLKKKNLPCALQDSRAYINSEVTPFLSHKHQFNTAKHQINTDKLSFIFSARITHDQELAFIKFRRFLLVKKEVKVFMCWHPGRSHYIWQFLCQVHENWHFSLRALFLVYLICFSFAGGMEFSSGKGRKPCPMHPTKYDIHWSSMIILPKATL